MHLALDLNCIYMYNKTLPNVFMAYLYIVLTLLKQRITLLYKLRVATTEFILLIG